MSPDVLRAALLGLALAQVELEVVLAWSKILLAASLLLLVGFDITDRQAPWKRPPEAGVWMLAVASAVFLAGEIWALAAVPPEERPDQPSTA